MIFKFNDIAVGANRDLPGCFRTCCQFIIVSFIAAFSDCQSAVVCCISTPPIWIFNCTRATFLISNGEHLSTAIDCNLEV